MDVGERSEKRETTKSLWRLAAHVHELVEKMAHL